MSNEAGSKIIDRIKTRDPNDKPFISIEYFPPRTETGVKVSADVVMICLHDRLIDSLTTMVSFWFCHAEFTFLIPTHPYAVGENKTNLIQKCPNRTKNVRTFMLAWIV